MITNYVLIDHVGSVEDIKKVYGLAYKVAARAGFVNTKETRKVWTMKQMCQTMSPYASQITDKMKYRARYTKHPKLVYLVCDTVESSKVDFIKSIWEERDITVQVVSEQDGVLPIEPKKEFDFGLNVSIYRECALIWADALGWSFSAPLLHDTGKVNTPDPWQRRPEHKEVVEIRNGEEITRADLLGNHISKISTNPEKFNEVFHEIASEDECKAFFKHYRWLWENNLLEESLEHGWKLCPECGRPYRYESQGEYRFDGWYTECYCHTLNPVAGQFDTFYDDSYEDTDEWA